MHRATLLLAWLTGCAHLMAPPTQTLTVTSDPPGATVSVYGTTAGRTPMSLQVSPAAPPDVAISLPGYKAQSCRVTTTPDLNYMRADLLWCVFGAFPLGCVAFIDADGTWNTLDSNTCHADLAPLSRPNLPPPAANDPAPPQPGT